MALRSYSYLAALMILVMTCNLLARRLGVRQSDNPVLVLYLCVAAAFMNIPQVRIEQGRLSLVGIINMTSAVLLTPLDATLVGISSAASVIGRGAFPILAHAAFSALTNVASSIAAAEAGRITHVAIVPRLSVIISYTTVNLALVLVALRVRQGEAMRQVAAHTFTPSFFVTFAYSGLAAIVVSYVLDGSPTGYFLATVVCVLALALTDTIAGRRVRQVLESELSDADRHLFHSRAVEGVVHNLRNHMATAVGYLKEIDPRRLDPVDREAIETATSAANDAVTVLRSLAQGATPRVTFATEPVDLNELVTRALGMARPRARTKEIQMAVRESPDDVRVRADPLLMREVITNLVNNAIDAAPVNGSVRLSTGRRSNGWPFFSVADDGPGVSEEQRPHLFEPHFTTKEGGTGLGLFMSYGIVREHQGDLICESSRRGAVFTVMLPPFPH